MKTFYLFSTVILLMAAGQLQAQCNYNTAIYYLVTTDSDYVPGSLRAAIDQANIDNTGGIIISASTDTVFLMAPLPTVTCDSLGIFPNVQVYIDAGYSFSDPGPQVTGSNSCFGSFVEFINTAPATFSVTTTVDSGPGSLRQAIIDANFSNSHDNIWFNIPGMAPQTISPLSILPDITQPMTIDGTTQPANGYTGSAPKIILDGITQSFTGLNFDYFYHNHLYDATVFGLHIRGFGTGLYTRRARSFILGSATKKNVISANNYGATFEYDSALTVTNNYIGTTADGDSIDGNINFGLSLICDTVGFRYFTNNVISGNASGLVIYTNVPPAPGSDIQIKGNLVGTDKAGSYAIPNLNIGIEAGNNHVLIGGTNPGDANLFSGNCINTAVSGKAALWVGTYCKVIGNKFGTNLTGSDTIPNAFGTGVYVGGDHVQIGGPTTAEGNLFAANVEGIYALAGSAWIEHNIFGTDITGSLNWGNYNGIGLYGDSNIVYNNMIKNNVNGISIAAASTHDTIINNDISINTSDAILNSGQFNVFTNNSIYDNGYGIRNYSGGNGNIAAPVFLYTTPDSIGGMALPGATVEIYNSASLNNTAQGKDYIGTAIADSLGFWQHPVASIPWFTPLMSTATQTDTSGNTSPFSLLWPQAAPAVWPGDCNYDLAVDNFDFLYMNLALNDTGPARAGGSTAWIAQPSTDWQGKYASGINHKHADCDGNGTVEMADTNAILINYGLSHLFKAPSLPAGINVLDINVTVDNDTVAPGDTVTFTLYVGNSAPVDSLFGMAWIYYFDPLYVDTNYVITDYGNSVLGTLHVNTESLEKNYLLQGSIHAALCRTDKTDTTSVSGILATITMRVKPTITSLSTLLFQPFLFRGLTAGERPLYFNANDVNVVIDPVLLSINESNGEDIGIYYNTMGDCLVADVPQGYKTCPLDVYNAAGALVKTEMIKAGENKIELNELPAGVYIYQVIGPGKTYNSRFCKYSK